MIVILTRAKKSPFMQSIGDNLRLKGNKRSFEDIVTHTQFCSNYFCWVLNIHRYYIILRCHTLLWHYVTHLFFSICFLNILTRIFFTVCSTWRVSSSDTMRFRQKIRCYLWVAAKHYRITLALANIPRAQTQTQFLCFVRHWPSARISRRGRV